VYPDFAGGCNYYRNTDTGVVMWTRPADFPAPDYTQHFSAGGRTSHLREGGGSKELDAGADDSDDPLAEDMCAKYTGAGVADTDTDQDDAHVQPVDDTTKLAWVLADTTRLAGDLKDKKVDPAWFESTFHDQDTTVKAKWVVRFSQDNDAKIVAPSALRADEQDLTLLDSLDPELVLFHLQKRFAKKAIYTNIGPIVVSINPLLKREAQQCVAHGHACNGFPVIWGSVLVTSGLIHSHQTACAVFVRMVGEVPPSLRSHLSTDERNLN
jgi:hypothetical protein